MMTKRSRWLTVILTAIAAMSLFKAASAAENSAESQARLDELPHAVARAPAGVDYTVNDGVHIFRIDMSAPHLAFETVMAHEQMDSFPGFRNELVRDMAWRHVGDGRSPILAFNADYPYNGPQGLTVRNGVRVPNAGRNNNDESLRSSFSVGIDRQLRMGRWTECTNSEPWGCADWQIDSDRFYNTVGGGPLFIVDGQKIQRWADDTLPCRLESIDRTFCTARRAFTGVAMTADGRTLIVIAIPEHRSRTMWEIGDILLAQGAWRALRLDGGGSTQVWFDGQEVVPSSVDRAVANAFMVFSSPQYCESFCDVWLDSVYRHEIRFLKNVDITRGDSAGGFRPEYTITRGETASLLWRWLERHVDPGVCRVSFPDLPPVDSPHRDALVNLACAGVLNGFSDCTIRPNATLTRAEAVTVLMRSLRLLHTDDEALSDEEWLDARRQGQPFPRCIWSGRPRR